jgi:hypothetical protein
MIAFLGYLRTPEAENSYLAEMQVINDESLFQSIKIVN